MIDDTYALLHWLEALSLKAHNNAERAVTEHGSDVYQAQEKAYNRVIAYVKTMGKPAEPYRHENQAGENKW